uniref:DUF4283 domain-containing protein n=1 Tax=Amaranthus palmeri TaxID=107608 RepID=A0A6C0T9H1_AMAPA|nr:hypothetical protein AP_R.00g000450-v1.0.a3 [Amaranthus palmeri]
MQLKYVPPVVENGCQVVHIDAHDASDLVKLWERAVVVYIVGSQVSIEILKGFIRKHWHNVSMPAIHRHEEGYFILRFNSDNECEEIIKGGPYFLNRAPMVVKKWNRSFDFREEIMRVIPVWVRLPNLPLHCWGVDTLSRIVSAIGVPILADECTAKQLKVSYARVLVEVDVTQEFIKEIKVRENSGREFVQLAIPEWKPFYCSKCDKLGHNCHGNANEIQGIPKKNLREENGTMENKKVWIPSTIVSMLQGVHTVSQLRHKLKEGCLGENEDQSVEGVTTIQDQNIGSMMQGQNTSKTDVQAAVSSCVDQSAEGAAVVTCSGQTIEGATDPSTGAVLTQQFDTIGQCSDQKSADEEGWTPVSYGKSSKKVQITVSHRGTQNARTETDPRLIVKEKLDVAAAQNNPRDGNPIIPSRK